MYLENKKFELSTWNNTTATYMVYQRIYDNIDHIFAYLNQKIFHLHPNIIFLLRSSIINSPVNNLVYLWIFIEFGFYMKSKFKGKIINFTFVS